MFVVVIFIFHLNEDADLKRGIVQHSSQLCVEVTGCLQEINWNSVNIVSGH